MLKPSAHISNATGEKLAQRLSLILARLHRGDAIDKRQLAEELQVNVRTIDRDLGQRLRHIAERKADGRWQLADSARSTIPSQHLQKYARLVGTEQLFPDTSLHYLLAQLGTPELRRAIRVQATSHEDLGAQGAHFLKLQHAIAQRHPCAFTYRDKCRDTHPYRLLHKNGVWYLAAEDHGQLKNFSVALITALQVDESQRFTSNPAHQDYIDSKDDVWFTAEATEVLLRVAPAAAHYFTRRALLPAQQQRADADGSLLVTAQIHHLQQLLPIVRYWLPHVRIVRPLQWHEELLSSLSQALVQWSSESKQAR